MINLSLLEYFTKLCPLGIFHKHAFPFPELIPPALHKKTHTHTQTHSKESIKDVVEFRRARTQVNRKRRKKNLLSIKKSLARILHAIIYVRNAYNRHLRKYIRLHICAYTRDQAHSAEKFLFFNKTFMRTLSSLKCSIFFAYVWTNQFKIKMMVKKNKYMRIYRKRASAQIFFRWKVFIRASSSSCQYSCTYMCVCVCVCRSQLTKLEKLILNFLNKY